MPKGNFFLFLILAVVCFTNAPAQIYSPAADDSLSAAYNPPSGNDVVFIFNVPVYKGSRTGSIVAVSPDRTTGWNFQWSVYNFNTHGYQNIFPAGSGSSSAIDTITANSGYRVVMTKGSASHTYRVWVLFNDFNVVITNRDAENKLAFGYYNCSSLDLRSDTSLFPLSYPEPFADTAINIQNVYTIRWTTDNPEASNPSSRLITRVYNPPSTDTWYILTLTDRFGLKRSDSVLYESIQSEAKITAAYVNLGDTSAYPGRDYGYYYENGIKSAPGNYRFDFSSSINAVNYAIDFGDGQSFETTVAGEPVMHEFQMPGKYKVVLTTKSAQPFECADTATVTAELVYAGFLMPNVFSPNDDGNNDLLTLYDDNNLFRSGDVSVVSIDITIFDRSGTKMHEYNGNIRDWKGWDGKVMRSNRNAPEGVYYYAISFFYAYEDKENPIGTGVMKGFFHLFRE
ncbi:MAG: gliding motility-associated C-terminal domain-containing protein [Bacteroidales bacterium]|nr:gliding motility-associated C-terminal domain-containing protein [Bacteroidales bacterium]